MVRDKAVLNFVQRIQNLPQQHRQNDNNNDKRTKKHRKEHEDGQGALTSVPPGSKASVGAAIQTGWLELRKGFHTLLASEDAMQELLPHSQSPPQACRSEGTAAVQAAVSSAAAQAAVSSAAGSVGDNAEPVYLVVLRDGTLRASLQVYNRSTTLNQLKQRKPVSQRQLHKRKGQARSQGHMLQDELETETEARETEATVQNLRDEKSKQQEQQEKQEQQKGTESGQDTAEAVLGDLFASAAVPADPKITLASAAEASSATNAGLLPPAAALGAAQPERQLQGQSGQSADPLVAFARRSIFVQVVLPHRTPTRSLDRAQSHTRRHDPAHSGDPTNTSGPNRTHSDVGIASEQLAIRIESVQPCLPNTADDLHRGAAAATVQTAAAVDTEWVVEPVIAADSCVHRSEHGCINRSMAEFAIDTLLPPASTAPTPAHTIADISSAYGIVRVGPWKVRITASTDAPECVPYRSGIAGDVPGESPSVTHSHKHSGSLLTSLCDVLPGSFSYCVQVHSSSSSSTALASSAPSAPLLHLNCLAEAGALPDSGSVYEDSHADTILELGLGLYYEVDKLLKHSNHAVHAGLATDLVATSDSDCFRQFIQELTRANSSHFSSVISSSFDLRCLISSNLKDGSGSGSGDATSDGCSPYPNISESESTTTVKAPCLNGGLSAPEHRVGGDLLPQSGAAEMLPAACSAQLLQAGLQGMELRLREGLPLLVPITAVVHTTAKRRSDPVSAALEDSSKEEKEAGERYSTTTTRTTTIATPTSIHYSTPASGQKQRGIFIKLSYEFIG